MPALARYSIAQGLEASSVVARDIDGRNVAVEAPVEVKLVPCRRWSDRVLAGHRFRDSVCAAAQYGQTVIHDHGAWLQTNRAAARAATALGAPLVISPRGMFSSWALKAGGLKKRLAWFAYQRNLLERAAAVHVTAEHEARELRAVGYRGPLAIVPNGMAIPEADHRPLDQAPNTAVFIGRVHPKKGLDRLIRAWAQVVWRGDPWTLRIVGPDDCGHRAELESLAKGLEVEQSVVFQDAVDDGEKWKVLGDARVAVLPSHSENFGGSVVEALAAGRPVMASKQTPWSSLRDARCGWWEDNSVEALTSWLERLDAMPTAELASMGECGRKLVLQRFAWPGIAEQMLALYRWALDPGGSPVPAHLQC